MKRDYKGLTCRVIHTEPLNLLVTSNVKLRAKTSNNSWKEEDVDLSVSGSNITGQGSVSVIGDETGF